MIFNKHNLIKIFVILLIAIISIISFIGLNPFSYHNELKIITGPTSGSFYKLAVDYQKILVERGFKVNIEPVANTSDLVRLVNNSEDVNTISFLLGPADVSYLENVRSLGIVAKQPLFIFQNRKKGPLKNLATLKGKKILLPNKTSITANISLKILDLYGVNDKNSTIEFAPLSEMIKKLIVGDYDAGFVQLSIENLLIQQLILNKELYLFSYDNIHGILNKLSYFDFSQLPKGSFDILNNIPSQPVSLLINNVEVITNKNLNPSIAYTLLESFESLHNQRTLISQAGEFPKYIGTQVKLLELIFEYKKSGTPWFYKNFSIFYSTIISNYIIYFLIFILFIEFYKSINYFHDFLYLCIEYVSLKIIEKNKRRIKSGQELGNFSQIVHGWAVDAIERKTIRQRAVKMIAELKDHSK
jgi:TRAP-type uncharacterized transport system substrate-binding protein